MNLSKANLAFVYSVQTSYTIINSVVYTCAFLMLLLFSLYYEYLFKRDSIRLYCVYCLARSGNIKLTRYIKAASLLILFYLFIF
jgi:hypothetical protein